MKYSLKTMTATSLLVAIVAVMTFTPLGYLKIGFVEITLMCIPVGVGGILLGRKCGAVLGTAFGISSFVVGVSGASPLSPLASVNILMFAAVCIIPRFLAGYLPPLLLGKMKPGVLKYTLGGILCPVLNTVFFVTALFLCYYNSELLSSFRGDMPLIPFIAAFVSFNGIIEWIAGGVITPLIAVPIGKVMKR